MPSNRIDVALPPTLRENLKRPRHIGNFPTFPDSACIVKPSIQES